MGSSQRHPLNDEAPVPRLEQAMSGVAAAIADPSRVAILCALMDGRAWTATELSTVADIAPSTASGHLSRLMQHGLIVCLSQGRHRYYRLAGHEIAGLLENLMGVSMSPRRVPEPGTPVHLRQARTCYDHLAGELAVKMYAFMLAQQWLTPEGDALTVEGRQHFAALGVPLALKPRRKVCCPCLDWSERRYHLGGEAGAALLTRFVEQGWFVRTPGYREILVTPAGRTALHRYFGIDTVYPD
ncbi:Transcriptional regulator, ArsR family [Cronobacter condimenti 1330]|uniref:ArsR family transcriptional regulator n=1 Tax=Cronobacter condimenti 1330 TaxID=1073999 RepID=K8A3A7_9ENTR|nr:winged helix-turn-helix domain-containing protein [Cronobacter condimenti]ALB64896.1 ArsR family transcriptional regulator [Cronobacter condimenti 1330]CCJ74321.1 Transcriptional regulator, ArsR family [Cronobacter condimenti 1330]